jgi:hypothetical protein
MEIQVENSELRTVREAMREMGAILAQLEKGEAEKVVLTSKGKMRGVLISIETYSRLVSPSDPSGYNRKTITTAEIAEGEITK